MSATATSRLGRHRSTLVLVGATLLALAVALLLGSGGARTNAPHDPDNPGSTGARAVAQVLRDEGVDVTVARSADELEAVTVDTGTTVLVTSSDHLGRSTATRLLDHAAEGRLVVAAPGPGATEALGVARQPQHADLTGPTDVACAGTGLALSGLEVEVDGGLAWPTGSGCFREGDGWLAATPRERLVLLGVPGILENDQVLRADNAAVALRLLGQEERLVWYVPDLADLVADDGVSLRGLLPPWLLPGVWLLALAALATMWWRGRRLGPLAVEPLPVAVRAIETTQGRGRLYRRAGDRGHAAEALRRASRTDAARHLRLPADEPEALVRELARHTGRAVEHVDRLLGPHAPPPRTDDELIRLANDLATLDREVRHP